MTIELTPDITLRIAKWALSDDTGVSSETIAAVAVGEYAIRTPFDMPYDDSDFGRCYRLLKMIPELREVLPLVVKVCPKWGPLVEVWDELTELYEKDFAEEPVYERRKISGRYRLVQINQSRCYERIRALRDACYEADGMVKISEGHWVRKQP